MTLTESQLPLIWNDEVVLAWDHARRLLRTGSRDNPDDPRPIWELGSNDNAHTHDTDPETGLYLGPVSYFPYYAAEYGLLLYTANFLQIWPENIARIALGDRVLSGVNLGRYARILHTQAGTPTVLTTIGEIFGASFNLEVGNFTNLAGVLLQTLDPVDIPDKDDWRLRVQTNPSTIPPDSADITILATNPDLFTPERLEYFVTVIPRYLPFWLTKFVRVKVLFVNPTTLYWSITPHTIVTLEVDAR